MQLLEANDVKLAAGSGDPAIVLRRVSLAGSLTTGVLLLLFLAPAYQLPSGVASNVLLLLFLPLGYVLTYVSYEMSSRYLCHWGERAFINGFREALEDGFGDASGYRRYRSFRGSFLSDPAAPNALKIELKQSRDMRKQTAYIAAMCAVVLPIATAVSVISRDRLEAALVVAISALLLGLGCIFAFRVRSITLGRAYGLAYEWAVCNERLQEYAFMSPAA